MKLRGKTITKSAAFSSSGIKIKVNIKIEDEELSENETNISIKHIFDNIYNVLKFTRWGFNLCVEVDTNSAPIGY